MYTFDGQIRYSEIDKTGKLAIPRLFDYFQDCSVFQSEELGVGVEYLAKVRRAWVLNSWQVVIHRLPLECEKVETSTWASGFDKFHGTRNFSMKTKDGEVLAYANSIWVYIDTENGRPTKPTEEEIDLYQVERPLAMDYQPRKIDLPKEWEEREPWPVKSHWIDSNLHVNNSRYVQVACSELSALANIRQVRVEYKRQAMEGDILYPKCAKEEGRTVVALCNQEGKPYAVVEFRGI